jgi:hypothetical protein
MFHVWIGYGSLKERKMGILNCGGRMFEMTRFLSGSRICADSADGTEKLWSIGPKYFCGIGQIGGNL